MFIYIYTQYTHIHNMYTHIYKHTFILTRLPLLFTCLDYNLIQEVNVNTPLTCIKSSLRKLFYVEQIHLLPFFNKLKTKHITYDVLIM